MTNKEIRYKALVEKINAVDLTEMNQNNRIKLRKYNCGQVNFWNYWEGKDHLDAKVFLVGQDWGALDNKDETIYDALESGTVDQNYQYMKNNKNLTNKRICELFREIHPDYNLMEDTNTYHDLYFTNFIPWYREEGKKISGGYGIGWTEMAIPFFQELVDIIKPEIILCLGRTVLEGVVNSCEMTAYKICDSYNQCIEKGAFSAILNGNELKIVPLAHCGSYGTINRNKNSEDKSKDSLELQKKDWRKIRNLLHNDKLR